MTATPPPGFSKTPPVEDGNFHMMRIHLKQHSEPLIGQKTGNWWLILGWHCDEYCTEDLVKMGVTFGPRISLPQPDGGEPADVAWLEANGVIDRTKGKPGQGELAFYSWPLDENQGNDECWIFGIELLARPMFAEDEMLAIWNPTKRQVRLLAAALTPNGGLGE